MNQGRYQIIVIGAGSGGLVVAIGAAKAGKKVLLIEKGHYGGDCTNFGCVPSKTLIASAEVAHSLKEADTFGLDTSCSVNDTKGVFERVRNTVSSIRAHEEPQILQEMGVETVTGVASFLDAHRLQVNEASGQTREVYGESIVIATGASARIPDIGSLQGTPYLTNETLFNLTKAPKKLCILGGGPIGCEMAQAFSRLDTHVIQVHRHGNLLNREEPEAQELIHKTFESEGIELCLGFETEAVHYENGEFRIEIKSRDEKKEINGDALLVAIGRVPNIKELELDAAKIAFSEKGIQVDKYGRTSQKHIWAVGDVVEGGPKFTHAAENQARKVLTSLLLPIKKKIEDQAMPRVTFTDPEVASFGLLEEQAKELYGDNCAVYQVPFSENDRAITGNRTDGFVKVVTKKMSSKILGATIVGTRAGEMLPEISLAAKEKVPFRKLASLIHPYPIYNLAIRKASDLWLTQTFLPWLKHPFKGINWKRFIPLMIILALIIVGYFTGVYKYFSIETLKDRQDEIKAFVRAHFILAPLIFIFAYIALTGLSLPGATILSLIGGFLFPIPWSTLYVVIGATLGASIIFLATRTAFREILRHKAGPFLKKMQEGFEKNAWSYLLFLRLVPLFPFWLVNVAAGFFQVRFLTFLWTTFVGIIPGAYVYTQAGAGIAEILKSEDPISIGSIFNKQLLISVVALVVLICFSFILKKIRGKKSDV